MLKSKILFFPLSMHPASRKKQKNPLLRHNSEDDEMRFSGLHGKHDIPSKSFKMLQNLTVTDSQDDASSQDTQDDGEKTIYENVCIFSYFEKNLFNFISTFLLHV